MDAPPGEFGDSRDDVVREVREVLPWVTCAEVRGRLCDEPTAPAASLVEYFLDVAPALAQGEALEMVSLEPSAMGLEDGEPPRAAPAPVPAAPQPAGGGRAAAEERRAEAQAERKRAAETSLNAQLSDIRALQKQRWADQRRRGHTGAPPAAAAAPSLDQSSQLLDVRRRRGAQWRESALARKRVWMVADLESASKERELRAAEGPPQPEAKKRRGFVHTLAHLNDPDEIGKARTACPARRERCPF
eukprot:m51a1_g9702 hypothetical protein (246) ;mRNA; r:1386576-1387544